MNSLMDGKWAEFGRICILLCTYVTNLKVRNEALSIFRIGKCGRVYLSSNLRLLRVPEKVNGNILQTEAQEQKLLLI